MKGIVLNVIELFFPKEKESTTDEMIKIIDRRIEAEKKGEIKEGTPLKDVINVIGHGKIFDGDLIYCKFYTELSTLIRPLSINYGYFENSYFIPLGNREITGTLPIDTEIKLLSILKSFIEKNGIPQLTS